MQKRDFILLSTTLKETRARTTPDGRARAALDLVAHDLADAISRNHSGFDKGKFLQDIGCPQTIIR